MPQLETLVVNFEFPVSDHDIESRVTTTPITTPITLPNLRLFWFRGVCAYLEAFVHQITTPRLERLLIRIFKDSRFPFLISHSL